MTKRTEGRLRILYVQDILRTCPGPGHAITMAQLLSLLGERGISAERRSLYDDFRQLERYGMQVARTSRGRYSRYYWKR